MALTEAELQATIIDTAELAGWLVYHDHDSRLNPAGLPDLIFIVDTNKEHLAIDEARVGGSSNF